MIFGNIKDIEAYGFLEENVLKFLKYAKNNDLVNFETGSYEIDGDNVFVNIVEYETTTPENRVWEAHRRYLDLHMMLKGAEEMDVNFVDNMVQKEFAEKDDLLFLEGEKNSHVILSAGDFLICYPEDGHKTAIQVNGPEQVKKAVFKIRIK